VDVTSIDGPQQGVEVDLVHETGAWSVRLTCDRRTGVVALVAMDHSSGKVVLAEVLHG
jgi:hypothetical protein